MIWSEFDCYDQLMLADVLTISDLGHAVLKRDVDFLSLRPPTRWVGGVQIGAGLPDWRWNEQIRDAECR